MLVTHSKAPPLWSEASHVKSWKQNEVKRWTYRLELDIIIIVTESTVVRFDYNKQKKRYKYEISDS